MKSVMLFPSPESERAISGYSSTLTNSMRKIGLDMKDLEYSAGKPTSLFKILKKLTSPDIVHIQHEYNLLGWYGLPFFFLLGFLKMFSRGKIIITMHTVLSQSEKFKGSKLKTFSRKILYELQNRWINYTSDQVVVHARFFKDILVKEYGFEKDKVSIFPQGIIEGIKTLSKSEAKKKFKLSGPVYLFMGSMIPDHGHDIIIKQAKKIGGTILIVANPGSVNDRNSRRTRDYLEKNKEYSKKHSLEKFVRFDISDITDKSPNWWEYFSAADLVMLPYSGGIGSGIFAHAMAMKKPVIASNIKFFKEISENFKCIKIAKKDSEYAKIIKESMQSKEYKKMIEGCESYMDQNGLTPLSKKYKEVYQLLLK